MEPTTPYELLVRVEPADIDRLGHVNNIVYLRWVQDAAIAHWQTLASPEHQAEIVWMALRHEIDYKAQAVEGDEIMVRTWIGTAEGLRFERFTEMLRNGDRKLLAQARTVWCPVDPKTGRPKRVGADVYRLFSKT
jgi:acyl-CoA thioester hydrolase